MAARVREHATYEDLIKVPDHMVAELIEGELYASPRPAGPHAIASSALGMLIGPGYQLGRGGPGGWWLIDEPELHLGTNVLVPDLAGWRRERMPDPPKTHVFSIVPDWVCEVTSPTCGRLDRLKKMPIYAGHEVAYAWLLEPEQHILEVRRLDGSQWLVIAEHGDAGIVRVPPFEEVEIDLTLIWGPPVS